jgi:hypothetical protein
VTLGQQRVGPLVHHLGPPGCIVVLPVQPGRRQADLRRVAEITVILDVRATAARVLVPSLLATMDLLHTLLAVAEHLDRSCPVFSEPSHHWLRISRVLASTRILGLEIPRRALFAFLKELRDTGATSIPADTFGYWQAAVGLANVRADREGGPG